MGSRSDESIRIREVSDAAFCRITFDICSTLASLVGKAARSAKCRRSNFLRFSRATVGGNLIYAAHAKRDV